MKYADMSDHIEGDGQLLPYYRKQKFPPGIQHPSNMDADHDELATRLGVDPVEEVEYLAEEEVERGKVAGDAYPSSPARRRGPADVWEDHKYVYRLPSQLHPQTDEEEGDDMVDPRIWPNRSQQMKAIAERIIEAVAAERAYFRIIYRDEYDEVRNVYLDSMMHLKPWKRAHPNAEILEGPTVEFRTDVPEDRWVYGRAASG